MQQNLFNCPAKYQKSPEAWNQVKKLIEEPVKSTCASEYGEKHFIFELYMFLMTTFKENVDAQFESKANNM
jgi:hypothetical protein